VEERQLLVPCQEPEAYLGQNRNKARQGIRLDEYP
jgi:hypothetical protein